MSNMSISCNWWFRHDFYSRLLEDLKVKCSWSSLIHWPSLTLPTENPDFELDGIHDLLLPSSPIGPWHLNGRNLTQADCAFRTDAFHGWNVSKVASWGGFEDRSVCWSILNQTSLIPTTPYNLTIFRLIEQPTHFFRTPSRAVWALAQFTANTLWIRRIRSWTTHSLRVITDFQKAHGQMVVSVGGLEFQHKKYMSLFMANSKNRNHQSKPQGRSSCWNYVQFTCRGWRSYIYVH